jgi:hypothetical protein
MFLSKTNDNQIKNYDIENINYLNSINNLPDYYSKLY